MGRYDLIVPKGYGPGKSWPLVFSCQDSPSLEQIRTVPYFMVRNIQRGYPKGMVALENKTRSILEDAARDFNIDPFRIYATGFSFGGHTCLVQAWRHPHWFAAIAPVCNDLRAKNAPLVKHITTPTFLLHGTGDSFLNTGKQILAFMQEAGRDVRWETYPGGHNADVPFRENVKMLTRFFDEHTLDPFPRIVHHVVEHKRYSRAFWVDATLVEDKGGLQAVFEVRVRDGNRIEVEATDDIAGLDLHLNEKLVKMDEPVTVVRGEKVLYEGEPKAKMTVKLREGKDYHPEEIVPLWQQIVEIRKAAAPPPVKTVRLKATADIGVSDVVWQGNDERVASWGLSKRFKLKSIQEMGVIRFDATPARGREVLGAKLFLHRAGKDMLRYIRVSTVNGDWEEGATPGDYGPPSGACFNYADWDSKREWAWPGSQLCDVIMGAGNSLHYWPECKKLDGGWLSVDLAPELVYALAAGDTDGLAVQDGGNLAYFNNFIHSVQSGEFAPYIEVVLGRELVAVPGKPIARAEPGAELARMGTGAVKLTIRPDDGVFCWRVRLNGKPAPRRQVAHPAPEGPTAFFIQDLPPSHRCEVEVLAVSAGGRASEPAKVTVDSSPALTIPFCLRRPYEPTGRTGRVPGNGRMKVWPCPGLAKVSPTGSASMFGDMAGKGDASGPNAVWDGKRVSLFGCRGEYVSCQLVINNAGKQALAGVRVIAADLEGPGDSAIAGDEIELYKDWYAQNGDKKWQPAYCIPLKHGEAFGIPDPERRLDGQRNQSVYVDVYVPKDARPGDYSGSVKVEAEGARPVSIPVTVRVYDFSMPDRLSFWPQLNCYRLPREGRDASLDFYRLAHQHRCVFFQRNFKPQLEGKGKDIRVVWDRYDNAVGPLLSGEAFKDCRRGAVPIEALGLPYGDSWPTPLSKETYRYDGTWLRASEKDRSKFKELTKVINEHYMTAPYIGDGLTREYKDAFVAVQRQFIEHFREKGWDRTECQCLFMGKNTHRIRYNSNMWWTTDEPYHWDDWLALQFFARLWTENRGEGNAEQWVFRADISRPQWQARTLDGIVDNIHFGTGAFSSPAMYRRCRELARRGGFDVRVYGGASRDTRSNTESVVWILNAWLNGANAALPWQTMGNDGSLDVNDASVGGNALLAPGNRFGIPAVADIRLKAFRDAEQLVEYLAIFARKYRLTREQVKAIVCLAVQVEAGLAPGAGADNADALRFKTLKAWQLAELRRSLAKLIAGR